MTTLSRPPLARSSIRRVAILFAGGPAPAANAVISTAAASFLRNDIEVLGILHGYSHLIEFDGRPLQEGRDYVRLDHRMLRRTRVSRGILIGTARATRAGTSPAPATSTTPRRSPRCGPSTRRWSRSASTP